jgi:hypothetical protein
MTTPRASAQDDLTELRELWKAGKYEEVVIKAKEKRDLPFGKTLELDYIIGTSCCRVPDGQVFGIKYLAWCLSNYQPSEQDKAALVKETERCAQVLASVPPPALITPANKASLGGEAGVSGKMLHGFSEEELLGATTIKVVFPKTFAELRARLSAISQPDSAAAKVARLVGEKFEVRALGKFVIASANPEVDYKEMSRRLNVYEKFFANEFGLQLPPFMVTVYVVPDRQQYRDLALKLHGFQMPEASIGYSFREDLSLAAWCPGALTSTLYHELFHLMARSTFGDIPPWLDEGMAALYEVSVIDGDRVRGTDNWRGRVLRDLWGRRPRVEKLVQMPWKEFDQFENEHLPEGRIERQAVHHAMARYFLQFLQDQNLLAEVFNAFRRRHPENVQATPEADAVATLEKVLQKPVAVIDGDFEKWFRAKPR